MQEKHILYNIFKRGDVVICLWIRVSLLEERSKGGGGGRSYFDNPSVLEKMASVVFVFQGETSEHLWCSSEQHAGLELQAAPVHKNA